jgi:ubiquinone biosynthesis protein
MPHTEQHTNGGGVAERRKRYREIAQILWEERLLDAVRETGLEEYLPAGPGPAPTVGGGGKDLPAEVRIRRALERLGPVYVKVGQLFATRADVVPPALLQELRNLQDNVPPVPWPEIKESIEAELGASVPKLFRGVKHTPLAAASIGQVHRGILRDGTRVAIKVRRPGVVEAMELDLEILNSLARKLAGRVEWVRDNHLVEFLEEFSEVIRQELDYRNEGRSLDRLGRGFANEASIVFPGVYWDRTTEGVLTMDLLEGVPLTRLEQGAAAEESEEIDRRLLVRLGVDAYFRMIFRLGFYHADPHAGNLFALPGHRLGFVDLGRVATVSEHTSRAAFDMLLAVFDDDPAALTEAVFAVTGVPSQIDVAAFELDVGTLLGQFRKQQESGDGLDKLMQGLLRLMREHRLMIPGELSRLVTTVGVLDGVAHQIDPDFRMIDAAKPFARRYLPERYGPQHAWETITRSSRAYARLLNGFPVHAERALRRIGEGEFKLAVRPTDYHDVVDRLTAVIYLLAYAVIVGALIIGFAFLSGRQGLSVPESVVYRSVLFLAVASVIGLFVAIVRSERRKRRTGKRPQG